MTHYELLGIDPCATPAEIHAAYRTRARQAHPDTGQTDTGDQMAAINEAWHVLGDPTRRLAYDTIIGRHGTIADGAKPRPASTPPEADLGPDAVSGSSLRLLRRLLVTAMILAVAAMAAIVLIGFLQGP